MINLINGNITSLTYTSINTNANANQIIDSFSINDIRSVKYQLQISSGTSYQAIELSILHAGSGIDPLISEYDNINTSGVLATLDAVISGDKLYLVFTPVNSITLVKAIRTSINT